MRCWPSRASRWRCQSCSAGPGWRCSPTRRWTAPTGCGSRSLLDLIDAYDYEVDFFRRLIVGQLDTDRGYRVLQTIPGGRRHLRGGARRRDRRRQPFLGSGEAGVVGGADPETSRVRHHRAARPHHQTGLEAGPLGRRRKPSRNSPSTSSCAPTGTASPLVAAVASARSPPPADCSPTSTTASATAKSAASPARRPHETLGRTGRALAAGHDPTAVAWPSA